MVKKLFLLAALTLSLVVAGMAQEMTRKPEHGTGVTVIVTHEVKDYATWRKGYDADETNRQKAGFRVRGVYADVKNPNLVSIIGEFPSVAAAEAFTTSPKLKEVMEKAGVIGMPEVKILTRAPK
jgi:quinol monooxygenase YgiN